MDAVRSTGADNLVIIHWGYGIWANPKSNCLLDTVESYPVKGKNIVYSTHIYRGPSGQARGSFDMHNKPYEYHTLKPKYQFCRLERVVKTLNKPLIIGEIGAEMRLKGRELEQDLAFLENSLRILNEWEVGYLAWAWAVPEWLLHGVLQDTSFSPNEAGKILIKAIKEGGTVGKAKN